MGKFLRRFGRLKQPNVQHASDLCAAAITTLRALRDSADAFPPLKSATGGVLHLMELCDTVKANREECLALARRAEEILYRINDVVPDPTKIPPSLLDRISDFARSMEPIQEYMEALNGDRRFKNRLKRYIRHREDQDKISGLNQNLDRAFHAFQMTSLITLQMGVVKLDQDIVDLGARLDTNLNITPRILLRGEARWQAGSADAQRPLQRSATISTRLGLVTVVLSAPGVGCPGWGCGP
ncbi:hypothetical protein JB92DRAFT_2835613 [Gautieria morchelliformis]|nr:hypothetical protein JB92DRAFT_2835613 [Gautieria morchelliformis]